jgi:hypothetical protein
VRALALGDGVPDVGLKEDGVGEGRQNLDKSMPDNMFSKVSTLVYIYCTKSPYNRGLLRICCRSRHPPSTQALQMLRLSVSDAAHSVISIPESASGLGGESLYVQACPVSKETQCRGKRDLLASRRDLAAAQSQPSRAHALNELAVIQLHGVVGVLEDGGELVVHELHVALVPRAYQVPHRW